MEYPGMSLIFGFLKRLVGFISYPHEYLSFHKDLNLVAVFCLPVQKNITLTM